MRSSRTSTPERAVDLDELLVREGVRDTIARYAHAADGGRFADLADLFAPDGVLELGPPDARRFEGRAAIRDFLGSVGSAGGRDARPAPDPSPSGIRHHVASTWITVEGPGRVIARSYFLVVTDAGPDHWGRYRDELAPIDGCWRFTHRLALTDGAVPGGWAAARRAGA